MDSPVSCRTRCSSACAEPIAAPLPGTTCAVPRAGWQSIPTPARIHVMAILLRRVIDASREDTYAGKRSAVGPLGSGIWRCAIYAVCFAANGWAIAIP
jgi:hypothetical protein